VAGSNVSLPYELEKYKNRFTDFKNGQSTNDSWIFFNINISLSYSCSMANTLWLDPLIEREYLPKLNIWNERLSVRALLLEKNFVIENSEVFIYQVI